MVPPIELKLEIVHKSDCCNDGFDIKPVIERNSNPNSHRFTITHKKPEDRMRLNSTYEGIFDQLHRISEFRFATLGSSPTYKYLQRKPKLFEEDAGMQLRSESKTTLGNHFSIIT